MRDLELERKFFQRLFASAGLAFVLGIISIFFGLELLLVDTFWANNQGIFWTCQGIWLMVLSIIFAGIIKSAQKS